MLVRRYHFLLGLLILAAVIGLPVVLWARTTLAEPVRLCISTGVSTIAAFTFSIATLRYIGLSHRRLIALYVGVERLSDSLDERAALERELIERLGMPARGDEPQAIEDELAEVSKNLADDLTKLHGITMRAHELEREVRDLVEQAAVAKTTASLHEEDALRIAVLLGKNNQQQLEGLAAKQVEQLDLLRRSNNRSTWLTFVAGGLLGFGVNIITTWLMS